jgi:PEP-CTERM motif
MKLSSFAAHCVCAFGVSLALASVTSAAMIIATTATGSGADTHLANDSQQAQTTSHGLQTTNDTRAIQDSRARIGMLRFDLSGVSGAVSGVQLQLQLTTSTRTRDWVIYGLNDDGLSAATTSDNWDEATVTYSNAPGIDLAGAVANSGNYAFDASKVTPLVTWNVQNVVGVQTSPSSAALDAFINSAISNPNNKLVTLFLSYDAGRTSTDSNPSWAFAAKENATGTAPPALLAVPEPASLVLVGLVVAAGLGWTRTRRAS